MATYTYSQSTADLQKSLNAKGANLKVDGFNGPLTQAAATKYGSASTTTTAPKTTTTTTPKTNTSVNQTQVPGQSKVPTSTKTSSSAAIPSDQRSGKNTTTTSTAEIQKNLGIKSDGIYGSQTSAAVKAFQQANGLVADGIFGPKTQAAYNAKYGSGAAGAGDQTNPQDQTQPKTPLEQTQDKNNPIIDNAEQQQQDINNNLDEAFNTFNQTMQRYINGTIPLTTAEQAQVNGLTQQYQALIDQQKLANTNAEGVANIRGYQTGSAEYDPTFQAKTIGSIVTGGINKIADLNNKMAGEIATLTEKFKTDDMAAIKSAWDSYSAYAKQKNDTLQQTIENAQKAISDAQKVADDKRDFEYKQQQDLQNYQLEQQKFALDQQKAKADIANVYDQIAQRAYERTLPNQGKPFTDAQQQSAGYAARVELANKTFQNLNATFSNMNYAQFALLQSNSALANMVLSPEQQQIAQAERNFINAQLRRESGAAISQSEFDNARTQYFPQYGDSPAVMAQKQANRELVQRSLISASSGAYQPLTDDELKLAGLPTTSGDAVAKLATFKNVSSQNADLLESLSKIMPDATPEEIASYLNL